MKFLQVENLFQKEKVSNLEIKKLHQEITQKVELGYYNINSNSLNSLKTDFKFT